MIGRVEEGGNRWGSWVESVQSVGDAVGEVEGRGRAKLALDGLREGMLWCPYKRQFPPFC